MRKTILVISILSGFLFSCKKEKIGPSTSLIGKWKYEYEILKDGTKNHDNPYALLEFEYSDGLILHADKTGNSLWYDRINNPEPFGWSFDDSKLKIVVSYSDGSSKEFEYSIINLKDNSMDFQTPKGSKYHMLKQ